MRFLLFVVVLFATGYSVNGWGLKKLPLIEKPSSRQIRATTCEQAYEETFSTRFEDCQNYLDVDDDEDYTPELLDSFCNNHCIRTLAPVYRDIGNLCPDSGVSA